MFPSSNRRRGIGSVAATLACVLLVAAVEPAEQDAEAAKLKSDIALYAETNACGEEPLADGLRATVLLAEANRGRSAQHILETRQAFLDAWRERARRPAPSASVCRTVADQAQTRADALRR